MPMIDDILMKAFARPDAGTNPVLHYPDQAGNTVIDGTPVSVTRVWHHPKYVPQRQLPDNACVECFSGLKIRKFLHQQLRILDEILR